MHEKRKTSNKTAAGKVIAVRFIFAVKLSVVFFSFIAFVLIPALLLILGHAGFYILSVLNYFIDYRICNFKIFFSEWMWFNPAINFSSDAH